MFNELAKIDSRPEPFEYYTALDLWNDEYTSSQMLAFHLNDEIEAASRKSAFINRSVEWITSHFKVGPGTRIVDFGCGPGLYAIRLAKKQAEVTGIDFSTRSIQYAREAAEKEKIGIKYLNENYLDFETDERFDLILMIMCDFCVLSPLQRDRMLSKFFKFLKPGGAVFLDVYSLEAFKEREEKRVFEPNLLNGFWSPQKYYGFLNIFKYEAEKVILDKYTIIEADRTRTIYNWLQYYDPGKLEKEFSKYGFKNINLYSDVAGTTFNPESKEYAIEAHKE
jgi:2-polyprenyl-3-methyl-5-hydroxy-6-metoxy-1,4-benzoquinol methylase